jgi:hypothetical protein
MSRPTLAEFMNAAPAPAPSTGNTPWAAEQARRLIDIVQRYSARRPRSLQRHLGPSELGVECDRQVVGKLLGEPSTNHVTDPWPSFMGTAGHAEMEDVFAWENSQIGGIRYFTERRVTPPPPLDGHPGTADLYDGLEYAVLDHKFLGVTSMRKVMSADGPPRKYRAQLGIYGLGYLREGFRVDRVALIAWPRTGSSLSGLYVWEQPMDAAMAVLLKEVAADTERRKWYAAAVANAQETGFGMTLDQVPRTPSHDECYFCPFYRPSASDGIGCPGTVNS